MLFRSDFTIEVIAKLFRERARARFFFNDTATTEIYTLSLHDALPISHFSGEFSVREHADDGGG